VPLHTSTTVERATRSNGGISLEITGEGGARTLHADHIIAATGYKVDLTRLAFMDAGLLNSVQTERQFPVLSSNFETTVPGLYFVGASAAARFGPLMFFVFGTDFAADRVAKRLAKARMRNPARASAGRGVSPAIGSRVEDQA